MISLLAVCQPWNKWSECTATCGGGSHHRQRNCSVEDEGKNNTYSEGQIEDCNTQPCPPGKTISYSVISSLKCDIKACVITSP